MASNSDKSDEVILSVGGVEFPCHRKILAEHSPYFEAMFSSNFIEKDKKSIEIKGVDPDAMDLLLKSIYSKKEVDLLKSKDILSVLQAASMLQFESVQKNSVELIVHHWLTVSTCLPTMIIGDKLDLITLYNKARALALWEFSQVKGTSSFLELSLLQLKCYLGSDGLNITEGEFEVFEAIITWLNNASIRSKSILQVLECVRFSDISVSDIKTMLLYPVVSETNEVSQILKCLIGIKEGKDLAGGSIDAISNFVTEENVIEGEGSKEKKLKTCMCVNSEKSTERNSILNCCCSCCSVQDAATPSDDSDDQSVGSNDGAKFSSKTIESTKRLLELPPRAIPLVPCLVGHKCDKVSGKKPYLIYFNEGKLQPIQPLLHLSKACDGPYEPIGYKVLRRGEALYMIGGEYVIGAGNWNRSIWKYDIIRELWNYETSLSTPRRHHSVCCLGDYIYIIGGFGRHRVIMDSVEKYNIKSRCWDLCASLPNSLYSAACCVFKGQIFVFGPKIYFYEPDRDVWYAYPEVPLPSMIAFTSAMPHGEWIYLTGTYSTELLRFAPHMNAYGNKHQRDSKIEKVGSFSHNTTNTCLVHNVIYSFSTDDCEIMYVEAYYIDENKFSVLWESAPVCCDGIVDFSPKFSIGCFPLLKY